MLLGKHVFYDFLTKTLYVRRLIRTSFHLVFIIVFNANEIANVTYLFFLVFKYAKSQMLEHSLSNPYEVYAIYQCCLHKLNGGLRIHVCHNSWYGLRVGRPTVTVNIHVIRYSGYGIVGTRSHLQGSGSLD